MEENPKIKALIEAVASANEAAAVVPEDAPGCLELKASLKTLSDASADVVSEFLAHLETTTVQYAEMRKEIDRLSEIVVQAEKTGVVKKQPTSEALGKALQDKINAKQKEAEKQSAETAKKDADQLNKLAEKKAKEEEAARKKAEADKQKEIAEEEKAFAAKAKADKLVAVRFLKSPGGSPFFIGSSIGSLWADTEERCKELIETGYAKLVK